MCTGRVSALPSEILLLHTGVAKNCESAIGNCSSAIRRLAIGWILYRLVHEMEGLHGHLNLVFKDSPSLEVVRAGSGGKVSFLYSDAKRTLAV
jgi:hypothetical protein